MCPPPRLPKLRLWLAALALTATPVASAFEVYHSASGGTNPGTPATIPTGGSTVIQLYFDNGTTPSAGTPCRNGDGDEVCGFVIQVQPTGGVTLDLGGFTPAPGVVFTLTPTLLRAAGGEPSNGDMGPTKVGDLSVSAADVGSLEVTGDEWADASVQLRPVSSATIAQTGAGPLDLDGDAVLNSADNCPTVANGAAQASLPGVGNQADADSDAVGDACDNCVATPNARVTLTTVDALRGCSGCSTATGDQLDDDADGFGNACDGDFDQSGGLVNSGDAGLFKGAFFQPSGSSAACSGGPCDKFDLDGSGGLINASDAGLFKSLFFNPPGPACPQCGPPFDPNLPCAGDACP